MPLKFFFPIMKYSGKKDHFTRVFYCCHLSSYLKRNKKLVLRQFQALISNTIWVLIADVATDNTIATL